MPKIVCCGMLYEARTEKEMVEKWMSHLNAAHTAWYTGAGGKNKKIQITSLIADVSKSFYLSSEE